jgi:arylsulfatase A-like enzyme
MSDNGLSLGSHRWSKKFCAYDECAKVPLFVRGPGLVPRTDEHLALNVDLAPTAADFARATIPNPINGRSLRPLLADPTTPWRDAALLEWIQNLGDQMDMQAVRTEDFLYVEYFNGDRELYDLRSDPFELDNVVASPDYASVVADLQGRLAGLRAE